MGQMDGCGTEDLGLVARLLYGYVLSCEGVLSGVETSWVLLAGLIPQDVSDCETLWGGGKGGEGWGGEMANVVGGDIGQSAA